MGRSSGATALLAVAGLWTLCCVFAFGRFLGGEQPLDPRFHRARPDASEDSARHLGSSGRLTSSTQHGAVARHELDAFTGHGDFAERRHGDGVAGAALPLRESRRAKPFGDERVSGANGAMRVFAGHAAFDAATRSSEARSERSAGREIPKNANAVRGALDALPESRDEKDAVGMESAPAFEAGEIEDAARAETDYADARIDDGEKNNPTVLREQDVSASLAAVARRVAEREARQETETLEQQVARLKDEALGRRGGALG